MYAPATIGYTAMQGIPMHYGNHVFDSVTFVRVCCVSSTWNGSTRASRKTTKLVWSFVVIGQSKESVNLLNGDGPDASYNHILKQKRILLRMSRFQDF